MVAGDGAAKAVLLHAWSGINNASGPKNWQVLMTSNSVELGIVQLEIFLVAGCHSCTCVCRSAYSISTM